jgi:predicted ATPase
MAKGRTNHPILENPAALQRTIKDMQLRLERSLPPGDVAFLDGAVPSSLAWYRAFGLNPNVILPDCFHHRYASVFVLDSLPFQTGEERVAEVTAIAGGLHQVLGATQRSLAYARELNHTNAVTGAHWLSEVLHYE